MDAIVDGKWVRVEEEREQLRGKGSNQSTYTADQMAE